VEEFLKDPVCGMTVQPDRSLSVAHAGRTFYFCSDYCANRFLTQPELFLRTLRAGGREEAPGSRRVAYFSMEVAVGPGMPTYAGGLGVLAGDTLKSCADLRVPVVGVSLLHRKGYFDQRLDAGGWQQEQPTRWRPEQFLRLLPGTVEVSLERRRVLVRAWQYDVTGQGGYVVPLLLLDTDVEGNAGEDRALTDSLYGGEDRYRLAQEVVLGVGGVRTLRALGYSGLGKYHLNEGHASLLILELLRERSPSRPAEWDFDGVRGQCVFTTHTPVPAGHDQFDYELVRGVVGEPVPPSILRMLGGPDRMNMTLLALNQSRYVNGVARRHEEVSREMFPGHAISHITNGVHSLTWTCDSFRALYDRRIPGWGNDPALLRQAVTLPPGDVWGAHCAAKLQLLAAVEQRAGVAPSPDALTVGFARRATRYKRADLLFSEVDRLRGIAARVGPLQFIFAGKAHPRDEEGKGLIRRIVDVARQAGGDLQVVYLENYDLELARLLVSGCDLWLNTPQRPLEASGTSGMKAAHNGVPSFSTLDGWWVEGCVEGRTGWSIGAREPGPSDADSVNRQDADSLYRKLESVVAPLFYHDRERWVDVMRQAISLNASYFNTHRMVQQYVTNAYLP
jgi:glycogen phosphorylase